MIDDSKFKSDNICYIQPKPYKTLRYNEDTRIQDLAQFNENYKEPVKDGKNYLLETFETVISKLLSIDASKMPSS